MAWRTLDFADFGFLRAAAVAPVVHIADPQANARR